MRNLTALNETWNYFNVIYVTENQRQNSQCDFLSPILPVGITEKSKNLSEIRFFTKNQKCSFTQQSSFLLDSKVSTSSRHLIKLKVYNFRRFGEVNRTF